MHLHTGLFLARSEWLRSFGRFAYFTIGAIHYSKNTKGNWSSVHIEFDVDF